MATYLLTAVATPTPISQTVPSIGSGSNVTSLQFPYAPVYQSQRGGFSNAINQLAKALMAIMQAGSGGYAIMSDLALSSLGGLLIAVDPGVALLDGVMELVASGPQVPYQAQVPAPYSLDDDSTNYVFLTQDPVTGAVGLVKSLTLAFPTNAKLFLGTVTTLAGAITNIDASGVVSISGGQFTRQTADIGPPTDAPPSMHLITLTTTGQYLWNGSAHVRQEPPPGFLAISVDTAITPLHPRTLYVTASVDGKYIILPPLASMDAGAAFQIINNGSGGGHDIGVKANTADGSTVLVNTTGGANPMSPGTGQLIPTKYQAGVNTYPGSSPYTPGTPVAGVPGAPI